MKTTSLIAVLAGVALWGCVGSGYPGSYRRNAPYYGDYGRGPYYGGPSYESGPRPQDARDVARDQARDERRLYRNQQERRENLQEKQAERRQELKAEGDWKKKNVQWQRERREQQREQFQKERERLEKQQDREWDRDGY